MCNDTFAFGLGEEKRPHEEERKGIGARENKYIESWIATRRPAM